MHHEGVAIDSPVSFWRPRPRGRAIIVSAPQGQSSRVYPTHVFPSGFAALHRAKAQNRGPMNTQTSPIAPQPPALPKTATGTGVLPATAPPLPLEREVVVRWLIEELPHTLCADPNKSRMPVDATVVSNLFTQDLDIMFKSGAPDATRFARCWKSMSKRLEAVGQDAMPIMSLSDIQRWAVSNPPAPPAPPPPAPPEQHIDMDVLLGDPPPASLAPPDLSFPPPPDPPLPSDPLFSLAPPDPTAPPPTAPVLPTVSIPAAPPIPGDGTVSGPPTGFTPPTAPMPIHQVTPPAQMVTPPDPAKRARRKRYARNTVIGVVAIWLVFGLIFLIAKNSGSITTAFRELTKPKPQPAPTAQPAPVQTAQPVPVAPAEVISAKCDYLTDGIRLAPCEWVKGPGPFQCDIGAQDGTGFAKCGEFIYRSEPLPTWGGKGITVEFRR